MTVNPTLIGLNGTAVITVTGFRPDGNPLFPGTQITLTTTRGVLADTTLTVDDSGRARTTLTGSGQQGMATITASTPGADATATADVQIGEDATTQPVLTVTVAPNTLSLNETANVSVVVQNADGSQFTGQGNVQLETTLGTLVPADGVVPVVNGRATAQLESGSQVGTATVTAFFGAAMPATAMVTIENQRPTLIITANPSIIPVQGESQIDILARDENDNPVGAGRRIRLTADLGSIPSEVFTDETGEAEATFVAGDRAGTGNVTALLENSEVVTVNITIRDAVESLSLNANPTSVERRDEGAAITLRATALNAQGEAVGGVLVRFTAPVGRFNPATNGTVTTNAQGIAQETLTVSRLDLQAIPANGTFTVTATVTSEGGTVNATITITVVGAP